MTSSSILLRFGLKRERLRDLLATLLAPLDQAARLRWHAAGGAARSFSSR